MTAVEWLYNELSKNNISTDSVVKRINKESSIWKQAKEMEKEQMRSASCPYIGGWEDDEFEYWYNEKYKK